MKRCIHAQAALFILILFAVQLYAQAPKPGYVPPDASEYGLLAHNEHLAVIETDCTDMPTAIEMRNALTRNGALVSIITSPGRMLAWVPPAARSAVAATRLETAAGGLRVRSVSYNSAEFDRNRSGDQPDAAQNDADRAIVEFLDYIKRPLTEEDLRIIAEREKEVDALGPMTDQKECVTVHETHQDAPDEMYGGMPAVGGEDDPFDYTTGLQGYVVHSSFFMESQSGTGFWDWDSTTYARYRNFYIVGLNYWVSFAARYGKTITTYWRLFPPFSSVSQVTHEPTSVGEDAFVPQVLARLATPSASDGPPSWPDYSPASEWSWWYNRKVRGVFEADQSICGFIAYKPMGDEAIWPHVAKVAWNAGELEGLYFTMDTQYWQCELNPGALPMRNVIAHEIGHLWGAPDEYRDDNCNWSYRGMPNINCQTMHAAYGRPGFNMSGWDGIMKANYIGGNSVATPVHVGVISAAETAPVRIYSSSPSTLGHIGVLFRNCDNIESTYEVTPIGRAVDFDYCHSIEYPATRVKDGSTWYFDHWEITRKTGPAFTIDHTSNILPSSAYTSMFANPVTDIKGVYTNSPPAVFSSNPTLEAHLAPLGDSDVPNPGIALKWRNKYDMNDAKTILEYEASTNNWKPLTSSNFILGPFKVPVGHWTGVLIYAVPNASGSGSTDVQPGTQYRFRIVGEYNGNRGTPSVIASMTTRPASPPHGY